MTGHETHRAPVLVWPGSGMEVAVAPFDPLLIADFPAHVIAWSGEAPDAATVRAARPGAQASADPASEIRLVTPA